MDHKTVGLVGVISALTPLAATAAPSDRTLAEVMSPRSYAELLQPIPNASALLKEDAVRSQEQAGSKVQTAQYYGYPDGPYYHHHHHHHHITIITNTVGGTATPITITITTIITTTIGTGDESWSVGGRSSHGESMSAKDSFAWRVFDRLSDSVRLEPLGLSRIQLSDSLRAAPWMRR